jgi:hypothetical protein
VRHPCTFDVKRGVGFGVAQALGVLQGVDANERPLSRISDRIKLVVPLMMPAIQSIRLAVRPSLHGFDYRNTARDRRFKSHNHAT